MSEPQRFPMWKVAVDNFLTEFHYGDMVGLEWMATQFGMPSLTETQRLTVDQYQERQFEWLSNVESFKAALLQEHQVCLQSVRGQGYRWVPPHEQTAVAIREFEQGARKVFRNTGGKLRNLRHMELTDDQRRANMDAIAKISALSGMTRKGLQ